MTATTSPWAAPSSNPPPALALTFTPTPNQVGGAVICATKELHDTIKHMQNVHGNIMSPQNAFYTLQVSWPEPYP